MSSPRTLIVTGAGGFVAGSVLAQAGPTWERHAVSRRPPSGRAENLHWHQIDPFDRAQWTALFRAVSPAAVIHTAAAADIDFCQANREAATAANVDLTSTVADLCAAVGAKLVHCSTDNVFDGEHAPYTETVPPAPINWYAETKAAAERVVAAAKGATAIARLALVVGRPVLGTGNSFVPRLAAALREGRTVAVPEQEVRTPIDVLTLGRALLELAAGRFEGIYHLAGNDRLNRLDPTRRIAVRLGLPANLVVAAHPARLAGRAPRPRDVSLDNSKARAELETPMLGFDDGLSLALGAAPGVPC
jgi:dTDP-4-dehydrorhamnose reductase